MTTRIVLVHDRGVALVDDSDAAMVLASGAPHWWLSSDGYACTGQHRRGTHVWMHRLILGLGRGGPDVDHINGDRLDNRRANLRPASRTQNNANARPRGGSSRFKGVTWDRSKGKWMARVSGTFIGYFRDEDEAASAYDARAVEVFGPFGLTNRELSITPEQRAAVLAAMKAAPR